MDFSAEVSPDKARLIVRLGEETLALTASEVEQAIETLCAKRSLMLPVVAADPPPLDQHRTLAPPKLVPHTKKDRTEALLTYRDAGRGWIAIRIPAASALGVAHVFSTVAPAVPGSKHKH